MWSDDWPARITDERIRLLKKVGFKLDTDFGLLVHLKQRKVISIEAAAELERSDLREFAKIKGDPNEVKFLFFSHPWESLRNYLTRRYRWV